MRPPRRVWIGIAAGFVLILALFVRVTISEPRVHVRWDDGLSTADRRARELAYALHEGVRVDEGTNTWRYGLGDRSRGNIAALLHDQAAADVAYIDRDTLTAEPRQVEVTIRYPYDDLFDSPTQLLRLHRSVWLLLAGTVLVWGARAPTLRQRRTLAAATLLLVAAVTISFPHDPAWVTMGGSADHLESRADFEEWFGGRVRFEKHLSQILLLQVYERVEPTAAAPERAAMVVARGATVWFVASALAVGVLEAWSPVALRYLGLSLLAPSALLYFGWRELGYLSLNVAAFPLLARGLRDSTLRLEAGSALAGLGAALHGSGLVSLAGAWLAILGAAGSARQRMGRLLRALPWGTAAYLGWVALYVIVLKLPVSPDPGQAAFSSWRPWSEDEIRAGRTAAAILSAVGARDLAMSAWIVGAPLLPVALSLWRDQRDTVRAALWYLPPSLVFVLFRWPFEGVGGGMDLVVAGFPAFYALAWVCAQDARRATIAAALLASAHYAFWLVVLDQRFEP